MCIRDRILIRMRRLGSRKSIVSFEEDDFSPTSSGAGGVGVSGMGWNGVEVDTPEACHRRYSARLEKNRPPVRGRFVGERVGVAAGLVSTAVAAGTAVSVDVAVGVHVGVADSVGVCVGVAVAVEVAVLVGVAVRVAVGVGVSVGVGVKVGVGVSVAVGTGVWTTANSRTD